MGIIQELCSRFEYEDSRSFTNLFTEDALYLDSLYGTYEGQDAIMAFHRKCHEEAKDYRFQPVTTLSNGGENAAFEWNFSFVSLMPPSQGKEITLKGASFLTLKEGKIFSYREYADSISLLLCNNVPDKKIMEFYRHKYLSS